MLLRRSAWDRFCRDRLGMAALSWLLLIAALSAAAPDIATAVLHSDPDRFVRDAAGRIAILQPPAPTTRWAPMTWAETC